MTCEELQAQALRLTASEKIHLVEFLLESLDKPDPEIQKMWVQESEKRYDAFLEGKNKSTSYNDVMKRFN